MEIIISNQKGHRALLFFPIGYAEKIISNELKNKFIKKSDRTIFEFIGSNLESDLDVAISIAIEQGIKSVGIGVGITSDIYKLSKLNIESISFHNCIIDYKLFPEFDKVKYLTIGDSVKVDISFSNFPNLVDITFLSVKTFKVKILDKFEKVEKLILWYENKKSNDILKKFPKLKEFGINNGSIVELDITQNPNLEILELHRCIKLEKVIVPSGNSLKKVIVEASNKLDDSNFHDMKIEFRRW
ncbi:hypothetical protein [Chryseobacterium scophthalmum]|uniref:hypothetical protein n=1 Tax=Chryseobacterium scophthalmum TaxID=59733 RepID=UPI003CFEC8B4